MPTLESHYWKRCPAVVLPWWLGASMLLCGCHDPNPPEETLSKVVPNQSATDYALSFDGQNDYATLGTARFPMPTLAQSITLWIRADPQADSAALVTLRRDDSGSELGLTAGGVVTVWRIWGPLVLAEASEPLVKGRWHHVAYVFDTATHSIYIDGVARGSSTSSPNNHSPTSGWLGSFDGNQHFYRGAMDELRVWAVARTADEILAECDGNAPTSDPDLVAYFSFNEDGGTRAYDRSGNGNHVTLGDGIADLAPSRVASDRR